MLQVFFIFYCVVEGSCFLLLISNFVAGHLGAHKLPCDYFIHVFPVISELAFCRFHDAAEPGSWLESFTCW